MTQDLAPGAAIQMVGTTPTLAGTGASYVPVSGTITTATSTVATPSPGIGLAGNVTIYLYGTYAGVNAVFEISPDNTNWFPVSATREDSAISETSTGLLTNTARAWTTGAPGFSFFRVRATAWTSGTASVVIVAGTYPFEPMVSNTARKDGNRNQTNYYTQSHAATTATDALLTLTGYKGGVAVTGTTTPAVVTAGKTYRITSVVLGYIGIATLSGARFTLRANLSGVVAIGSPAVGSWWIGAETAGAGVYAQLTVDVPDGFEFPAGTGIGVSVLGLNTGGSGAIAGPAAIMIHGFEY
jgi:hypothetical protein